MTTKSNRSEKRLAAMKRLQSQKGSLRSGAPASDNQTEISAEYFEPFLRRGQVADASVGDRVSVKEFKAFFEEFKKQRRATRVTGTPERPASSAGGGWQSLLEQAKEQNFGDTFFRWLGGVSFDLGLSATPLEELERLREETDFRRRAMEVMLKLTNHELEELEAQIQAKKRLADGLA